jgi:hypothetical protein
MENNQTANNPIIINDIKDLKSYTDRFLCKISDNTYNIKFVNFRVRDLDSGFVLFEVKDEGEDDEEDIKIEELDDSTRIIKYHLGPDFLELKNIGTLLKFSVGNKAVKDFVLIERHYFKGKLIKSFEFKFEFCMPNSINEWETLYEIPELDDELKEEMIQSPWETKSDSFYFVDGKLIIHNKAIYNYSPLD